LCFVGQGSKFINEYGDIKEQFSISVMESAYKEACELIASKELEKKWESQFEEVAKASKNSGYSLW